MGFNQNDWMKYYKCISDTFLVIKFNVGMEKVKNRPEFQ